MLGDEMAAFDEAYYLSVYPDVAAAVRSGAIPSGLHHFTLWGAAAGRQGSATLEYSEAYYLAQHPDVAAAVQAGTYASGFDHYQKWGAAAGWAGNSFGSFNAAYYLAENPDVGPSGISPQQHFLSYGMAEGRDPNGVSFNESYYLSAHPDVAAAVASGVYASGYQHYQRWGAAAGWAPDASSFDSAAYYAAHPDVTAAVIAGTYLNAYDHWLKYGRAAWWGTFAPRTIDMTGASGAQHLTGTATGDTLIGGSGDDYLVGLVGFDNLQGGPGNDTLDGGNDVDTLLGGAGNDVLVGGWGQDQLTGGAGADRFLYRSLNDLGKETVVWNLGVGGFYTDILPGTEVVTDFQSAEGDKIDLSALTAGLGATYIGTSNFAISVAPQVRAEFVTYNGTPEAWVFIETSGNGMPEGSIRLIGVTSLTASDFILS